LLLGVADTLGVMFLGGLQATATELTFVTGTLEAFTFALKDLGLISEKLKDDPAFLARSKLHAVLTSEGRQCTRRPSVSRSHDKNGIRLVIDPDADKPKTKTGAGGGGGGTHIQKVEIVVTTNQEPSRIARLTVEKLQDISRFATSSPKTRHNFSQ
jgi:hypothetical protein